MCLCSICNTNPVEISAPRGWDSKTNSPAVAGECLECAIRDGWLLMDEDAGTVKGVPYGEWNPSPEEVANIAASMRRESSMWNRYPFYGGCNYYAVGRTHYVRGYYPTNEFEGSCLAWTASNLPGTTFWTADEAMDASDEAFYASGFVWESKEEEEEEEEEMVAEADEAGSEVWDPMQEAARVAGRVHYYWSY